MKLRAARWQRHGAVALELEWLAVWSPMVLLGAIAVAAGHEIAASTLPWVAVVMLAPLLARRLARWLRPALVVVAIALATILVAEASVARNTWRATPAQPATTNRALALVGPQVLSSGPEGGSAERVWKRRGAPGPTTVTFDLMRSEGPAGWSWFEYDAAFDVAPIPGEPGYARVVTPPDRGSYITRRIDTGEPLAGRTFRASLRLRTSEPLAYDERACRGVLLREVGGSAAACFPQALSTSWQRHDFTWQVPHEATSPSLRIELRVEAEWFEVGDVTLEERTPAGWIQLGPLEPAGLVITVAVPDAPPIDWPRTVLTPAADSWNPQRIEVDDSRLNAGDDLRVLIRMEPGSTVSLRDTTARNHLGQRLWPAPRPTRTQAWFGHPNLAGHALAVFAVVAASAAPTAVAAGLVASVSLAGISTTGSRTAFVVTLLATAVLVALRARHHRDRPAPRGLWLLIGVAAVALTVSTLSDRGSIVPSNDGNAVPRTEIWSFAWRALADHPFTGLGSTSLEDAWTARFGDVPSTPPTHAHNLWLELGAVHGVAGLVLALLWSFLLLWFTRHHLGSLGLVVTGAVLLLQLTDVTISNAYVYVPYAIYITIAFTNRQGALRVVPPRMIHS